MALHVVVIGAGVVGLCAGLYCAERGWRVTIVERNGERRDGCSFGNAGMIVPSHFVPLAAPGAVGRGLRWMLDASSPFYLKPRASTDLVSWAIRFWKACDAERVRRAAPLLRDLHFASRACYEELAAACGDFGFDETGTLMLCRTRHALDEETRTAEHASALGVRAEVLDAARTAALEPGVRMDVVGSVFYPDDCHLAPERLLGALQRRLAERGARFAWHTEAAGWRIADGAARALAVRRAGALDGETIEGDAFVLAAGSWSARLARLAGVRIALQGGKGYSLTVPRPRVLPKRAAILTEARVAMSPMGGRVRFGGTMEIAGLDESVSTRRVRAIVEAASRYFPDFTAADFEGIEPWRGLRPCSPDGLPFLGRAARVSNLLVATGHAMMGVSLAPITGKLTAQLIAGERPDVDLSLLSPDRYH